MGAATFVLEGATPVEVKRKLCDKRVETSHEGLCFDRQSQIQKTPDGKKYFAVLRVHT